MVRARDLPPIQAFLPNLAFTFAHTMHIPQPLFCKLSIVQSKHTFSKISHSRLGIPSDCFYCNPPSAFKYRNISGRELFSLSLHFIMSLCNLLCNLFTPIFLLSMTITFICRWAVTDHCHICLNFSSTCLFCLRRYATVYLE